MSDILVKARLKPGHKADLAAQIAGGTLAHGSPHEAALQRCLEEGRGIDNADDAYFTFPAEGDRIPDRAREVLERYFVLEREIPRAAVPSGELTRIEAFTPIPEWLGINADNWRND